MAKKDYLNLKGLTTYDSESKQYVKDQISNGIDNLRTTAYKTEAEWSKANPVLKKGEWAYSSDKAGMYKLGNGTSKWSELGYNHVTWANVEGKPSTFSPTAHKHTKSDITDFPSTMKNPNALTIKTNGTSQAVYDGGVAKEVNITASNIGLGNVNNTADKDKSVKYADSAGIASNVANAGVGSDNKARHVWFSNTNPETNRVYSDKFMYNPGTDTLTVGNITGKAGSVDWANVNGKPSTYTPSAHTHTKSQITDFPTSMPASDVYAWAKAASKPSYTKSEIGLGNVDNTADKDKSVKYAEKAGSLAYAEVVLSVGTENNEITTRTNKNNTFSIPQNGSSIRNALDFRWYGTHWQIGNLRGSDANSVGFGFSYFDTDNTLALKSYIDLNGVYHGNVAGDVTGNLTGNVTGHASTASVASAVRDYVSGSGKNIQIGWGGASVSTGDLRYIAGYWGTDAEPKIKDVSKDTLKSWIGLGSAAYTNSDSYAPSSHTHDDRYYTETEINDKVTALNNSIATKVTEKTIDTATNFNTFTTTGIYHIKFTGAPGQPTANHGTLIVDFSVGTPYQIWIPDNNMTAQYKRTYSSSTWSGWTTQELTDTVYTHPSYTAYTSGLYKITTNSLGHVTSATAVTKGDITALGIPGSNTDSKVLQTAVKSSDYTNWRTVLWGASNSGTEGFAPTTVTDSVFSSQTLTFQPSTGTLKANTFKGNLSGNATSATSATTATKLATARTISLTGSVTGSGSFDGSGNLSIATSTNHTHSYSSLTGTPTIGNGTITIKQNGTQKATFTMNQTGNTTVELTDTNTNTWRGIQNNLTSDSTSDSLAAAQGKALKGMVDAVNTKVDGIEIGGRNLLVKTNQVAAYWSNSHADGEYSCESTTWLGVNAVKMGCSKRSTSWKMFVYKISVEQFKKLKPGGSYVLSYDTDGGSSANFMDLMNTNTSGPIVKTFTQTAIKTNYGYHYTIKIVLKDTLTWGNQVVYLENNLGSGESVIIANLKLEEGNKATPWTPAPEDIDDSISSLSSRITTNTNSISSLKTTVSNKLDTSTFENYKSHTHKSVIDSGNNSSATTFAYSKAGMNYGDYSWLAGWNGYELRAVSKSQFATAGHNHDSVYSKLGHGHAIADVNGLQGSLDGKLSLSGGTMTGCIHIKGTAGSYNENIRIHPSGSNWSSIIMCGDDNTGDSGTSAKTWGIFTYNGDFSIAKNGTRLSANTAAVALTCKSGSWAVNGNDILDSSNYTKYAATAGHTHNYAGSSSVGGSANSAVKLTTARNIKVGGLSNFSFNFDGSGNISVDNWGYGTSKYVTTNSVSAPYFRIAYTETKSNYADASMILMIDSGNIGSGFGILKVTFRSDNISTAGKSYVELLWLVRKGFSEDQFFVKGYNPANETQYADLYFKASGTYCGVVVTALSMGARGSKSRSWTFDSGNPRSAADIRKYSYTTTSSDAGVTKTCTGNASTATKLTTARSINGTNFDGSGNITTANWGTARTITIGNTGKSVNGGGNVSWSLSEIGAAASSHSHNYAGSSSTGGSATSAVKLDTATAGSATQPVYFSGGKPVACTYTLGKSVPSNAVFTDTNTWRGIQNNLTSDSTSDSLSAAQGKVLKGLVDGKANSGHTHTKSQITNFPSSMPASDVYAWAKASTKPSYSWSEIGSKPSTFTPSSHDHSRTTLYTGSGSRPANINF